MTELGDFYDIHWRTTSHSDPASAEFQLKIFREFFPGFEEKVPRQLKWRHPDTTRILDVGCGPGLAAKTYFGEGLERVHYMGIDESQEAIEQARRYLHRSAILWRQNLMDRILVEGHRTKPWVDYIFCPGVLHYQQDMRKAVEHLSQYLRVGGRFVTWVYKEQAPVRKFTDNHLRRCELSKQELEGLTDLGVQIGHISDREGHFFVGPIPSLGIESGHYTLHELFYYYFIKLFYNESLTYDQHLVRNLNAYGPKHVLFLREEEIMAIFVENGFDFESFVSKGNGIGIVAVKTGLTEEEATYAQGSW